MDTVSNNNLMSNEGDLTQNEEQDTNVELTIKEQNEFLDKLEKEVVLKHLPKIIAISEKIYSFKGVHEALSESD